MSYNTESEYSKEINKKRVQDFCSELAQLLIKYKVEIRLEETSRGYCTTSNIEFQFDDYPENDKYVQYTDMNIGNGTILHNGKVTF